MSLHDERFEDFDAAMWCCSECGSERASDDTCLRTERGPVCRECCEVYGWAPKETA